MRARRVPGADHHEGQGGSQRRGTRWILRRGALRATDDVELVSPQGARRLRLSATRSATERNGTRTGNGTRVSPLREAQRVVFVPTMVRKASGLRFTPNEGSPRVARRCVHCTARVYDGSLVCRPHGRPTDPVGQREPSTPVGDTRPQAPHLPLCVVAVGVASSTCHMTAPGVGRTESTTPPWSCSVSYGGWAAPWPRQPGRARRTGSAVGSVDRDTGRQIMVVPWLGRRSIPGASREWARRRGTSWWPRERGAPCADRGVPTGRGGGRNPVSRPVAPRRRQGPALLASDLVVGAEPRRTADVVPQVTAWIPVGNPKVISPRHRPLSLVLALWRWDN